MKISPEQLHSQLASNTPPLLVDVRTPAEFREMSIAGALSLPLDELDVGKVKAMAVGSPHCVVVCYSGKRSDQACDKLHAAGLLKVSSLEGGLELWQRKNLPLERAAQGSFSMIRQVHIVAGSMILIGVLLSVMLSPRFVILPGFVGAGLLFAGLTGFCGMGLILAKMPWNKL